MSLGFCPPELSPTYPGMHCDPDALQQAYLEFMMRPRKNFDFRKRACCRLRDEYRRQKRRRPQYLRQRIYIRNPDSPDDRNYDSPDRLIQIQELAQIVNTELERLPLPDRQILVLSCIENMSSKQIAQQIGMNEQNVSKRLSRLKKRLKENPRLLACWKLDHLR